MLPVLLVINLYVFIFSASPNNSLIRNKYTSYILAAVLFLYVTIVIVISENTSIDMPRYLTDYFSFSHYSLGEALQISTREPLFATFQWLTSQFSSDPRFFYLSIWLLFSLVLLVSLRKLFSPSFLLITFFIYINFFIFFGYVTNTVRQGFSIAFLIYAAIQLVSKERHSFKFYISLVAAPLFHSTALPLSIALFLLNTLRLKYKTKLLTFSWILFSLLFVTNLNSNILGRLSAYIPDIESYASITAISNYGGTTNRLDFLAFSAFFLFFALWMNKRYLKNDSKYALLINIYIVFNIFFLALGFIGFSDRVAAYSWFLIPIMLVYPVYLKQKNQHLILPLLIIIFSVLSFINGSLLYNQPFLY